LLPCQLNSPAGSWPFWYVRTPSIRQCSGPALVCAVTGEPGRRLRTWYRAPGPAPSISTWPSMTSSDVVGIHQPTSCGSFGTPSVPPEADSGEASADTCRLGIRTDRTPAGSTAGMAGTGGTEDRVML